MSRLLASAWLVNNLLLLRGGCGVGGGGGSLCAEGARHRRRRNRNGNANGRDGNRRRRRSSGPSSSPPRPTRRFPGFSPGFDMSRGDDQEPTSSYFERNGIAPPPLIGRRAQAETGGTGGTPGSAENNIDVESLIFDTKHGHDANSVLRRDLIRQYDKHSYPYEYVWHNQTEGERTGVPVEMNINFHRVFAVDVVNSVMDLVVWLRLVWVDPRLTWIPEEYGGLTKTWFWLGDGSAGGETSELWTPDVELWNLDEGIKGSFEDAYAQVSYDGTVWWGRPGRLKPTCKFSGLDAFPFDRLTCTMEFGSWMHSGKYLRIEKYNGAGYTIGGSETAGERYTEYKFAESGPVTCEKYVYPSPEYATSTEEDWPVLFYNVTVTRSWEPYARGYITTQTLLNIVGFSAFWLPPSCGERMGLSITAMVAALMAEVAVAAKLPAASELTWFSKFNILSMAFAFVSMMECVVVLYFYYKRCDDCVPEWYSFAKNWYFVKQARKRGSAARKRSTEALARTAGFVAEATNVYVDALAFSANTVAHGANDALHASADVVTEAAKEAARRISTADDSDNSQDGIGNNGQSDESSRKFTLPETNSSRSAGQATASPCRRGSCATASVFPPNAPRDADDFLDEQEAENNMKWKQVAARIDDVARFWIPTAFVISLSIVVAEVF